MESGLNHFDSNGNAVMVDVSQKEITARAAAASGVITMHAAAFEALTAGRVGKGDVLCVARVAGMQALKRTAELIPLCHPVATDLASVDFELLPERSAVRVVCRVAAWGRTGVEMEALTGVSVALLTIYDMCKALDRGMLIGEIALDVKSGGQSGMYLREGAAP